jgi:hypothetical protein
LPQRRRRKDRQSRKPKRLPKREQLRATRERSGNWPLRFSRVARGRENPLGLLPAPSSRHFRPSPVGGAAGRHSPFLHHSPLMPTALL